MSPSENDLRAALHQGEGSPLDVDRIIAAGVAKRGQRRTRLVTAAVAGVFVAAAATTGTVLLTGGDSGPDRNDADKSVRSPATAGAQAPDAASPSSSGANASRTNGAAPPGGATAAKVACPTSFPRRVTPGGGSPGQFGSDGPLFSEPVGAVVVCAYGTDLVASQRGAPGRTVLAGADAVALQASLESAPKSPSGKACPTGKMRNYAIVGVLPSGKSLPVVTASLADQPCDAKVTNGTAIRYDWAPPDSIRQRLGTTTPTGPTASLPSHSPSGKNHGSPVR